MLFLCFVVVFYNFVCLFVCSRSIASTQKEHDFLFYFILIYRFFFLFSTTQCQIYKQKIAFLVQLTTVLVPLLSAITAGNLSAVPLQTWIACIVAFIGVIVMGADNNKDGNSVVLDLDTAILPSASDVVSSIDSSAIEVISSSSAALSNSNDPSGILEQLSSFDISSLQLSQGDLLIVLAAFSYTMHVVRLGAYAPRTTALKLAASKATTEAILSALLVGGLLLVGSMESSPLPEFVNKMGGEVLTYFKMIGNAIVNGGSSVNGGDNNSLVVSIAAILWTGWVTCAYTIYGM